MITIVIMTLFCTSCSFMQDLSPLRLKSATVRTEDLKCLIYSKIIMEATILPNITLVSQSILFRVNGQTLLGLEDSLLQSDQSRKA